MEEHARAVQPPPKALAKQCHTQIPSLLVSRDAAGHAPSSVLSGGLLTGCVFIIVIGKRIVRRYARGGTLSDEQVERDVRSRLAVRMKRGRLFGAASTFQS
jgi:hypothetical protein